MQNYNNISALLLAAGIGSRLRPLTDTWPKCLMPIGQRPLLEYWLSTLFLLNIKKTLVNLHYKHEIVKTFLERDRFKDWVTTAYERELLGTAGTLKRNLKFFQNDTLLLIHADNWCQCDLSSFIDFHLNDRPKNCMITMMTFDAENPSECGVVELDTQKIVTAFHEKITNPPSAIANAAIYLIEPEVLSWLADQESITDFSTEVLPRFIGKISTWHNTNIHRDIGTLKNLQKAQLDKRPIEAWNSLDQWDKDFSNNPIHKELML